MVGQVRMTGPDTLAGMAVFHGMKKGVPFNHVVCIGLNNVEARFTGPGQCIFTNHVACYDPGADADADGLPDPGAVPALCLPGSLSLETRVPIMPLPTPPPPGLSK